MRANSTVRHAVRSNNPSYSTKPILKKRKEHELHLLDKIMKEKQKRWLCKWRRTNKCQAPDWDHVIIRYLSIFRLHDSFVMSILLNLHFFRSLTTLLFILMLNNRILLKISGAFIQMQFAIHFGWRST